MPKAKDRRKDRKAGQQRGSRYQNSGVARECLMMSSSLRI